MSIGEVARKKYGIGVLNCGGVVSIDVGVCVSTVCQG